MKIRLAGALLLATLLVLAEAATLTAADLTGAEAVDTAWTKAMMAGDVNAVMACYASDAVLWFPGSAEARGEKAIRDLYTGFLSANTVTDVSIKNSHYDTVQNLSAGWANFSLTVQPKGGGAATSMHGRFIDVAKKIDGKWKYVADHASADPPPAEKPAATH
jgi:uncharacterized protein (TIGR02246 family)